MEDERLRAKMQLERDTLNRSILNSLPVDLAVINPQGVVVALNHPEQTLGFGASKEVRDPLFPSEEGEHFLELGTTRQGAFLAPYRAQAVNGVHSVLAGAAPQFSLEYPLDDSAQPHWSSMTVTPLGQDLQGAIIARQDITDLKQANLGLQQQTDIAEKANHAKSHFLATASHDLRQPLSALSLYVGVLGKRSEPHQKALVESIRGCVDSLSELLNDLLDVSKLDAGVVKTHAVDFAVDDVLASHIAIQSVSAGMKGLKLHMRPSGVVVHTDPKLLSRIVGNLVTNAIRYTQQGGVLLACRKHGNSWWLEVWDTGEGIPADKHHVIFEEFQQLNDTGRTRGSGLGLAIVKKMAALLGLTIRLRSRVGRGSVFAIELPAAKEAIAHEQTRVSQNQIPRSLRMAVLDDDSRVLSAMVMALQGVGHEVVAAADAEALVQRLEDTPPDIIISDYRLAEGRTGFEAVASVRKKFGKDDLPAIMVTGDTDPALIRSMADQGIAVHYKPVQLDTLQAFVKESVERRLL
jgi:signal transduction histidine kinase/ActR/RegA family two-component response regulator